MKSNTLPAALLALLATAAVSSGAAIFNGSGTSGFGGAIGGSTMSWTDDGSNITVAFTKGAGDFNDRFVIYLNTGATGRNAIGTEVNDRGDTLRSAISYIEAGAGKTLTFPAGFQASFAVAIDTSFGGLWSIPATGTVGDNGLPFAASLNSTLTAANQPTFTFTIPVASLGLTPNSGATVDFVATYENPFGGDLGRGFVSNEGYGGGFPVDNVGQNDFALTSALSYTIVPEPAATALGLVGSLLLLRRRR